MMRIAICVICEPNVPGRWLTNIYVQIALGYKRLCPDGHKTMLEDGQGEGTWWNIGRRKEHREKDHGERKKEQADAAGHGSKATYRSVQ